MSQPFRDSRSRRDEAPSCRATGVYPSAFPASCHIGAVPLTLPSPPKWGERVLQAWRGAAEPSLSWVRGAAPTQVEPALVLGFCDAFATAYRNVTPGV